MKKHFVVLSYVLIGFMTLSSCKTVRKLAADHNIYSIQDDIELGRQADQQIRSDTKNYKFLTPKHRNYKQVKSYLDRIQQRILSANDVPYEDVFNYNIQILKNDVVNAFATAGGYLYLYYGIMNMLDNEAQLAGVIAHEMGHVAHRHATNEMTAQQITGGLLALGLKIGKAEEQAEQVAGLAYNLAFLKYGRDAEEQADLSGATWLSKTQYNPYEMQGFFKKIRDAKRPPEFLSTHPDPNNRITYIGGVLKKMGVKNQGKLYEQEYKAFKKLLY